MALRTMSEVLADLLSRMARVERRLARIGNGGQADATGVRVPGVPGVMTAYGGATAPEGALLCNGAGYVPSEYPLLFAAIGNIYGGTTAAPLLPNANGRTLVGLDAAQTEFNALGKTGGAKTVTLTAAQLPQHQHPLTTNGGNVGYGEAGGDNKYTTGYGSTRNNGDLKTGWQDAPYGQAHPNLQPFLVANIIIWTGQ